MERLQQAVADTLAGAPGPVVVGFSGGLDSTVLLHAAATAAAAVRPIALHVNHGLHPDAARWQAHCERVAAALGVGFAARAVEVDPRGSLEASARRARYAVFAEFLAAPGSRLLLAHHRDDQTETVLLRLLQGRGGYGMPASRPLAAGRLLRPLLDLPRADLLRYAERHELAWIDDPSNFDLGPDRNYLRRRVLPVLRERWPAVGDALLAIGRREAAVQARILDADAARLDGDTMPVAWLLAQAPARQVALLRLWLARDGRPAPGRRALTEFVAQLASAPHRQPRLDVDGVSVRRFEGRLHRVEPAPALADAYALPAPGELRLPHGVLEIAADARGFEARGALVVRFRRAGETLRTGGHTRTVKRLLQQAGIPPWLRDRYPLVADEDGLAAVPGVAARDVDVPGRGPRWSVRWRPAARF